MSEAAHIKYVLRWTGKSYSVWRRDGTRIVYRDTCSRTARQVCRELNGGVAP